MTGLESVLGGVVIAVLSGIAGKITGEHGKVSDISCTDHRSACNSLINNKLVNIEKKVDELTKAVNNKLFGL